MRIRVSHETTYRYEQPPKGVIQTLRMTPRNHDGQYVVNWRIDISADCRLDAQEDAFGNLTHTFNADGPLETADIQKTYEELKAKGVEFTSPPKEQFYGIEATFKDAAGNWFSLTQPKPH